MRIIASICCIILCILPISAEDKHSGQTEKRSAYSFGKRPIILIGVPVNATAGPKEKNEWFSGLLEQYLYFRLGASNSLEIIPSEKIHQALSDSKNPYSVSIISYDEMVKELGATHLLHHTYEVSRDGRMVHYYAEIISTAGSKSYSTYEKNFTFENFTAEMDSCVLWLFQKTDTPFDQKLLARFFKLKTLSSDFRVMKTIGRIICRKYAATQPELNTSIEALISIVEDDSHNLFAQFIAAKLLEYAEQYEEANTHLKSLLIVIPNYASLYSDVCRNYRLNGKYQEALSYAANAEKKGIITFPLMLEGAQSLEALGKFSKAVKAYQIILGSDSTDQTALLFFAREHNRNKEPQKAIEYADKILSINPKSGLANLEKGKAFIELKHYEEAEILLTKSAAQLKNASEPNKLIGDIHVIRQNFADAASFYDSAWAYNPQNFALLLTLFETWDNAKKAEKALKALQKAENLFPDSIVIQKLLGLSYYAAKDTANAIFHLEQFLKNRQKDARVLTVLGDIYTNKGNYEKAFYMYNHAMPLLPDKTQGTFSLALLYLRKGDTGAAISYLKDLIKKQPQNADAYRYLADAWFREESYTNALKIYKKARYFDKNNPYIQKRIAAAYFSLGEYNAAAREYITLLKTDKDDPEAHFYLAITYLNLKQQKKAEQALDKGFQTGKPGSDILFLMGEGYAKVLKPKKAIEYYTKCIGMNPKHEKALLKLAETYLEEKDTLSAAQTFLKLYKLDNSKYNSYFAQAGLLYEQINDTAKAYEVYTSFVKNNYTNPDINIHLARIEYRHKQFVSVIAILEKIPASKISEADDMMLLADSYCSTGKPREAIDWLEKIISKNGKNKEALKMLGISYEKTGDIDNALKVYKKVTDLSTGEEQSTYSFKIGLLLEKNRKKLDAINTYNKNIAEHPEDLRNYRQLITIYMDSENWGAAREILERSVTLPHVKPFYWKDLANVCLMQNDKAGAVNYFKKYLELNIRDDEAWYQLGELYYARGQYDKALENYEKANALKPNDFKIIYKTGTTYYKEKNIPRALEFFNKAYEIDSTNAEILNNLVLCYRSQSQANKLSETLKKIALLQPDNYQVRVELGSSLLEEGKASEAIKVLETASKMNPKDPETHIILAGVYASNGNENAQYSHLKKAIAENPENADIYSLMGKFYLEKGEDKTALPYIEKALKINPEHSDALYGYSKYLFNRGKIDEALVLIKKALKNDSFNPLYLGLYGWINYELGKKNLAFKTIENALTLDSANITILSCAGVLFKERGKNEEAKKILLKAISISDKCFECYATLGEIYFEETECAKAAGFFKRALKIKGYDEDIMMKYGRTLVLSYQNTEAQEIFERIFSTNPGNHEAFYRLSHIYLLSNNLNRVKTLTAKRKNNQKTVWDHLVEGEMHEITGNIDAAIISYTVTLRLQPDMAEAHAGIGRINLRKEQFNDAIVNFSKALVKDPYNPYLLLNLGKAYEGIGQLSSAENTYIDVSQKFPQIPETYMLIADIMNRQKEHQKAVEILLKGLKHNSENAALYSQLGHIYKAVGEFINAIEAYKNVLKYNEKRYLDTYLKIANIYHMELRNEKEAKRFLKKYLKKGGDKKLLEKYDLARLNI